jgi:histidinol phosphatase-like PHP family hydrolase
MKNPKWRIGVTISTHHVIELSEPTAKEACEKALQEAMESGDYYQTGHSAIVTSCLINDREAREFASYVPEYIERKENATDKR